MSPQPHPIIPPDRTGLSDHHESACSLCQKASVCSYLRLGHSYIVPFPTLVLAHPSGEKKKANRNVLVETARLTILEKEGEADGEEWE